MPRRRSRPTKTTQVGAKRKSDAARYRRFSTITGTSCSTLRMRSAVPCASLRLG